MSARNWAVFRQDFAGNEFLVERQLTERQAREMVVVYESRKHHQHYWACELEDPQTDYPGMLRASLEAGSSLDVSLKVLRNQGATLLQCVKAIQEVRNCGLGESKRLALNSSAFSDHLERQASLMDQIESGLEP